MDNDLMLVYLSLSLYVCVCVCVCVCGFCPVGFCPVFRWAFVLVGFCPHPDQRTILFWWYKPHSIMSALSENLIIIVHECLGLFW